MTPTPEQIYQLRRDAGLSLAAAAELVHVSGERSWRRYESGQHKLHGAIWELFQIKVKKILDEQNRSDY